MGDDWHLEAERQIEPMGDLKIELKHPIQQTRIPGEAGIWAFVAGDFLVFSLFFVLIAIGNQEQAEIFSASRESLDLRYGLANTLLLLTGSLFVAIGVERCRHGPAPSNRLWFRLAILSGLGFVVNKILEWGGKISAGLTPTTNDFYMYFFVFTAIHLVHVVVGTVVLGFLHNTAQKTDITAEDQRGLESGGIFWHLVDLLWIMLFALLYLV